MKPTSTRALTALCFIVVSIVAGCGDKTEPQVPGALEFVGGKDQSAVAGAAVLVAPSVKLLSTRGKPLSGALVNFASSGDGVVTPAQVVTNAQGIAALTSWTLPKRAGSHQLTATSEGVSAVNLNADATAGPAAKIARSSPETQNGVVGAIAGAAPVVLVADANDNPVANVQVRFTPSGNGTVSSATSTTDANGLARTDVWTLGTAAGPQTVLAEVVGAPLITPVAFMAVVSAAPAAKLAVVTQPVATDGIGQRLVVQPVVEIQDNFNNRVVTATSPVTAAVSGAGSEAISGTVTVLPVGGRAVFTDLTVNVSGAVSLQFTSGGLANASSASFNVPLAAQCPGNVLTLNYPLGESARFVGNGSTTPACLDLSAANAGQQYLIQFENISASGNSDTGLFPGQSTVQSGFAISVTTRNLPGTNVVANTRVTAAPAAAVHSWDFGAGEIFEIEPPAVVGAFKPAVIRRNLTIDANAASAAIAIGDTVVANMVGISRLGIPDGAQKAVVRYVGPDLIIAEDVRLPTLTRQGGGTNTPLTMADMEAIAADYALYAKVQADLFFGGRYNAMTEASGNPPIAIHSLMYADNIWGYTYPNGNYFVWDFWVGTNGQTKGVNQSTERSANNLFHHEIAHMRHAGMNERAANGYPRGNRWLVEGFARAAERWPVAMRLLGTTEFSRTGNIVLPGYSTQSLNSLEDVPVYTQASVSVYGGYAASSYIFDYFADQVQRNGHTNWRAALGDFLVNAGNETGLNVAINRYLPGVDYGTLFTRARLALFMDDYGPGLPDWSQYHQYQLRASRQTLNPQLDPRNLWQKIIPGTAFGDSRELPAGAAFGYLIDATAGSPNTRVTLQHPTAAYSVLSITRIR